MLGVEQRTWAGAGRLTPSSGSSEAQPWAWGAGGVALRRPVCWAWAVSQAGTDAYRHRPSQAGGDTSPWWF